MSEHARKRARAVLRGRDSGNIILLLDDLSGAILGLASLWEVNLRETDLTGASLSGADLGGADLTGANLSHANLTYTNLEEVDLSHADLSHADLRKATLVESNLMETILANCRIYGISVWNVELEGARQDNLVITDDDQPIITVDNLKVAQFIYLLLNNEEIRDAINTLTMKAVLILGRFTPPRKAILDALREELRKHNYIPILFDFDKPDRKDTFETLTTLARLVHFVIADITNPRSIPGELVSIVESLPSLPVQPILRYGSKPWGMYDHIKRYPWVLELQHYKNLDDLLPSLRKKVIVPAEQKAQELAKR